jgi:hypothetical protein
MLFPTSYPGLPRVEDSDSLQLVASPGYEVVLFQGPTVIGLHCGVPAIRVYCLLIVLLRVFGKVK